MLARLLLAVAVVAISPGAGATLYTWQEGGSTRISTAAPAWYSPDRTPQGPRVRVTQGQRLIDDTGLPLSRRRAIARHRDAMATLERARGEATSRTPGALRAYEAAVAAEKRARIEAGAPL